jgi:antagonist of KipI
MEAVKALEILSPGPLTTVQDLGRYGYGRYGVAPSGALDSFSLRVANLLAGNPEDEAGLEITLLGLKVQALTGLAVAVTGGDLQPRLNEKSLRMWCLHTIRKGDIISFKAPKSGFRSYLALGGGICVPTVMGSKSTNLSSGFGGLRGRPLQKGDILLSDSPHLYLDQAERAFDLERIPAYTRDWVLRVLFGPQDDHFTQEVRNSFLNSSFKVTSKSDRTGIRLTGPSIQKIEGMEDSIISEGVICGTIQVPGDGQPIIILGETVTGGYRKIATVIRADIPLLGQVKPEDQVRFSEVSMDKALESFREVEEMIAQFREGF